MLLQVAVQTVIEVGAGVWAHLYSWVEASRVKWLAQGHRETKCDPADIQTWNPSSKIHVSLTPDK
jgi:hypothetical protein